MAGPTECRTTVLKIRLPSARVCLTWRLGGVHRRQRIAAVEHVRRRQTFAGRHLQSKDDRWILHKDEASRGMAAWRRLIPCQMRVMEWADRGSAGVSNGVWASTWELYY